MGAIDLIPMVVQIVSGAAGGNLGGSLFRSLSLGIVGNSLAGLIGGGIGSQLVTTSLRLAATTATVADGPDPGALLAQATGGGIGGVLMTLLVGLVTKLGR